MVEVALEKTEEGVCIQPECGAPLALVKPAAARRLESLKNFAAARRSSRFPRSPPSVFP
jgi:hypothetical protein